MGYQYESEDDLCYSMKHPDGSSFRIAKAGLQQKIIDQIESMKPQKMADGGVVGVEEDPFAFDPFATPESASRPSATSLALLSADVPADEANRAAQIQAQKLAAEESAKKAIEARANGPLRLEATPGSAAQVELAGDKVPSVGDEAAKAQTEALSAIPQAPPVSTGIPTPKITDFGREASSITQDLTKGYQDLAAANEKAAQMQSQIYDKQAQDLADMSAKYQEQFNALEKERTDLIKGIEEGKVDPNRLWTNMDTGQKSMAVIGLILTSIGSGYRGTQNEGLKILDNMVNRDIELQKMELGKKQSLLALNLQKTGDLRQAEQLTRMQMASAVEARIRQVSSQSQSEQAKMNGQIAIAKIRAEMLPVQQKIAAESVARLNPMQATNMPFEQAYFALPEKMRDQAVKLPGNRLGIAINQAASKKIMDAVPAMDAAERGLTDLLDESKWRFLPTAEKGKLASQAKQLLLNLKGLYGTGALDRGTIEVTDEIIGDPSAFFQGESRARTAALLDSIRKDKDNLYKQNVIGYRPSNINFTPVK